MINALWLLLIVPMSMAFGAVIVCIIVAVHEVREFNKADIYRFGDFD